MIAQRARYEMHNRAALASGSENIVDLPSGYAPRGFRVSSEKKHYYGFDLPVVSDTMKAATEKTMTDEQLALTKYCAVDATNYESMRKALDGVQGEICIVTEGMLGYFNEPEIVSFCRAIHRLLEEFKKAEGKVEAIKIDVAYMPYVSSAGLRVLLIMYKSLNDKSKFELTGVSPQVKEIFEATGFDQFLL